MTTEKATLHQCTNAIAAVVAVFAVLASCDRKIPLRPQSGGKPYEVVAVAANDTALALLRAALETPAMGLPQSEKTFDVSLSRAATLNQTTRYARCIVMATTYDTGHRTTEILYEKDVYASPQLIVYVNTLSTRQLEKDKERVATAIERLIWQFETNAEIKRLRRHYNAEATETVMSDIGCDMLVPADMTHSKRGKDFIWMANNSNAVWQSICIYTYPEPNNDAAIVIRKRDSVMKANIPGEQPGMYMRTASLATLFRQTLQMGSRQITEVRGLWEMAGDAMGGPFVCLAFADSVNGRTVVAEGFVYAPDAPKRDLMRKLEAALFTLRLPKQ